MTPLIAAHAFAALTSVLLGAWQLFFSVKGDGAHRAVGRVWTTLMLFVAVSSFWIQELRTGRFSLLHILSVVTIVTVTLGVVAIARGDRLGHRGNMTGSWIGLCIAGIFAVVIPQRHIPQFVVNEPTQALAAGALVLTASAGLIFAGRRLAATYA
jgi:uncharacterized membrane protein